MMLQRTMRAGISLDVMAAPGVDRFLTLPSGVLRSRHHGADDAPLAIGVPGLSANCFTFNAIGDALGKHGRRLVTLDLRGRGRSAPGKPGTHGWDNHARDVLATADVLGVDQFDFIGHSMGAFIGLALMAIAPQRVRRMVLIDAVGVPHERAMPPILAAAQRLGAVYPSADTFIALVNAANVVPWSDFWESHYREDLVEVPGGVSQRAAKEAVLEDLSYAASTDVRALWAGVTAPALLVRAGISIVPGGDIITEADRDAFLRTATNAKAVQINANHYSVMNHPDTANAVLEHLA